MRVDLMGFLYRVMEELSNAGIPIVIRKNQDNILLYSVR